MRVYKFEKAMVIFRDYNGHDKECGITEITKNGSHDVEIQNFDFNEYMDQAERMFGELEATMFLGE